MARSRAAACAALTAAAVTALTFAPAVRPTLLVWDDRANLVENTRYQGFSVETLRWAFTTFHLGPWQPLSWLSWTVDHALWGGDPRGFYVTNVLLQCVCAALLTLVAWRLLPRVVPGLADRPPLLGALSAVAALLWAAHPQRVESVAWATERRDVLSCAFLLGATLAWIRHADGDASGVPWFRRGAWWAAFLLFACSLLSKATAMGFVLVLVLLDLHPFRRPVLARIAEKIPFALAGAATAAVAWLGQKSSESALTLDEIPLLQRLVVAGATVSHHLFATIVPVGLRAHVQRPEVADMLRADLVAGAVAAAALVVAAFALRRRFPSAATALGVYLVLLAPVSGLALTGSHLYADRYSHQATLALGLLVAGGAARLLVRDPPPVRTAPALAVLGALVTAYASGAFLYASEWRTPQTLWGNVLRFEPENWVAHEQLAKDAYDRGDLAAAEEHLVRSLASKPSRLVATKFLTTVQTKLGKLDDAERTIAPVIEHVPDDAEALRLRGTIASGRGEVADALAYYKKSLEIAPANVETLQLTGELLSNSGRNAEAEEIARRIVAAAPRSAPARVFLGSLVGARGDLAGAEKLFREALDLDPRSALALSWLGGTLAQRGRVAEAEPYFRRAVAVAPSDAQSWASLALIVTVLSKGGDLTEAAALAVHAADLAPAQSGPSLQAAEILLRAGRTDDARKYATAAKRLAEQAGDTATAGRADAVLRRIDGGR